MNKANQQVDNIIHLIPLGCAFLLEKYKVSKKELRTYRIYILLLYTLIYISLISVILNGELDSSFMIKIIFGVLLSNILISISIIDIKFKLIPNIFSRNGLIIGIIFNIFNSMKLEWKDSLLLIIDLSLASSISYIVLESVRQITKFQFEKEFLGSGDSKLLAMSGAWLGFKGNTVCIAIAFTLAGLFAFIGRSTGKLKPFQAFPFAPFISLSIWVVWLWGVTLLWEYWKYLLVFKNTY